MKQKNIYNKVKLGVAALIASFGVGMMSSCGDFLEIEPQNEITLAKFWNEKNDVEQIIAGCYSGMQSYGMLSRMMVWGEFRSENVINNGSIEKDIDLERLLKENITASNAYTDWAEFYGIINRCNTVIHYAPAVAEKDPSYTISQLNAHIAEVTAIRSLCYFYLIRAFRDVPYSEEAYIDESSRELAIPASSFDEVLAKLIASLESVAGMAQTEYPESDVTSAYDYNCNRITQTAIYAMLCEMYLWQKNYDKCIYYADLVIDAKKIRAKNKGYKESDFADFYGYPLLTTKFKGSSTQYGADFYDIFVQGNSLESIFELNFTKGSGVNMNSNGPASNFYGAADREPWVKMTDYVGLDLIDDIKKVYHTGLDVRALECMSFAGDSPNRIVKCTTMGSAIIVAASGDNFKAIAKKSSWSTLYPTDGNDKNSLNKSNFIFYRITDIMLLKAEALAQKMVDDNGSLSPEQVTANAKYQAQAFELVDAVNRRALMEQSYKSVLKQTDYATKLAITNLVYEERHRELMFEGKRFFDLVRRSQRDGNTDYLVSHAANKDFQLKTVIESKMKKMDAIYWPYNINELKVNNYLVQNSAFGSGDDSSFKN